MAKKQVKTRASRREGNGLALVDAPWRHKYFDEKKVEGCFLCRALAASRRQDSKNLLLVRGRQAAIFLNRYPYTMGALMIAPVEHLGDYLAVAPETLAEMDSLIKLGIRILDRAIHPRAFNVGMNIGIDAGAGLSDHLHVHLVPRWRADTNFMTTTAGTRVLAEDMDSMYRRLRRAWRQVEQDDQPVRREK
jgi:ATP adenylyltransferase